MFVDLMLMYLRSLADTFTPEMCNDALASLQNVFSTGETIRHYWPVLPPFYLKPVVHLCVSGAINPHWSWRGHD